MQGPCRSHGQILQCLGLSGFTTQEFSSKNAQQRFCLNAMCFKQQFEIWTQAWDHAMNVDSPKKRTLNAEHCMCSEKMLLLGLCVCVCVCICVCARGLLGTHWQVLPSRTALLRTDRLGTSVWNDRLLLCLIIYSQASSSVPQRNTSARPCLWIPLAKAKRLAAQCLASKSFTDSTHICIIAEWDVCCVRANAEGQRKKVLASPRK